MQKNILSQAVANQLSLIKTQIPNIDTNDDIVQSFALGNAVVLTSLSNTINTQITQLFPQNAIDEITILNNAFTWTSNNVIRKQGQYASGFINVAVDTVDPVEIPANTFFSDAKGNEYKTIQPATTSLISVQLNQIIIDSNGKATCKTIQNSNHNLGNAQLITIDVTGNPFDINGEYVINVEDASTFTFETNITSAQTINATSSVFLYAKFYGCTLQVIALQVGALQNLTYLDSLFLQSDVNIIDNLGYIQYQGLSGGADAESIDSVKARTLNFISKPIISGGAAMYENFIIQNSVADKAFVYNVPNPTAIGIEAVLFKITNNTITQLTQAELTQAKNNFISGAKELDLFKTDQYSINFVNPNLIPVSITIAGLNPNTEEMKQQIILRIKETLFNTPIRKVLVDNNSLSSISDEALKDVIKNTLDSNNRTPTMTTIIINNNDLVNNNDLLIANSSSFIFQ